MNDPAIRLCTCTPACASALAAIGAQTFTETFSSSNTEEDMREYLAHNFTPELLLKELSCPLSQFYTAEAEGETAAYIKLNFGSAQTENFPGLAEVQRLYVLKKYKRAGLGTALMRQAERRARESGAAGLWLGVWEHNYPAQAFYQRQGFVRIGQHPFVLGEDVQTDLILCKRFD